MNTDTLYRGRFAPSPTGPLHFGSLVAAVGSFLEARAHGGQWLVRIEDLDTPRTAPGAADNLLRTLDALGMHHDGAVLYQSKRSDAYRAALDRLRARGLVYGCACSRREIADSALIGVEGPVYPGTCRRGLPPDTPARAWRMDTRAASVTFDDAIQGHYRQDIERDIGDFVLFRADGLFAYQLAVVVDDAEQGITHVVRGADLLGSTPRQIYLQRQLAYPTPHYAHLPVAVNDRGEKLSKQTRAPAIDVRQAATVLLAVLRFLGQSPPAEFARAGVSDVWAWCRDAWSLGRVPRQPSAPAPP